MNTTKQTNERDAMIARVKRAAGRVNALRADDSSILSAAVWADYYSLCDEQDAMARLAQSAQVAK